MKQSEVLHRIPGDYFSRSTVAVARDLLGTYIVRTVQNDVRVLARIVETEAYTEDDPACHGWRHRQQTANGERPEGKGAELFGPPGRAYVYLCYGVHWLFNVVTEPEGTCGAVLVRAVEPITGIEFMRERRTAARRDVDLTNGPGKLTQALDIDDRFHERLLTDQDLFLSYGDEDRPFEITSSPRIGISRATERKWRFFIEGNAYVSTP